MNQASVIGAALVIAYVIFVITKGELPCYMSVLGIATASKCPPALTPPGCTGSTSSTTTSSTTGGGGTGITITPGCISVHGAQVCIPFIGGPGGGGGVPPIGISLPPIGGLPGA